MTALEQWWRLLESMRMGADGRRVSYAGLAVALGVHENTVLAWARTSVPGLDHEAAIAAKAGLPPDQIARLLDAARLELATRRLEEDRARLERQRAAAVRPTLGATGRPADPRPASRPRSRDTRRKLAGVLFALTTLGSGWGLADAQPVGLAAHRTPSYRTRRWTWRLA